MFNEATCREILLSSLGNVNYYVAYVDSKYADLDGNNSLSKLEYKRFDFFFFFFERNQNIKSLISTYPSASNRTSAVFKENVAVFSLTFFAYALKVNLQPNTNFKK